MARKPKKSVEVEQAPRSTTAASRYETLAASREPFLRRARDCAMLTIPSLLPPEGHTGSSDLYKPFQSVGADGANNLSATLHLALFPPGESFHRFVIDDFVMDELTAAAGENAGQARGDLEEALGKMERSLTKKIESAGSRAADFEACLHLVVCGNILQYINDKHETTNYPLDRYVCKRDRSGRELEVIVKECLNRVALPKNVLEILERHEDFKSAEGKLRSNDEDDVELYTWVIRQPNGSWKVHQEVEGLIVPGSQGVYPKDKCAWVPLRWTPVAGEDYGRGRCEEYYGDLSSLEEAEKSIVRFAAVASKVVALVNEGGVTSMEELANAESGAIMHGDARDISWVKLEKAQDFQTVTTVSEDRRKRLERAFMLPTSITRNAERVTAEEIRILAGALEKGLGGTYSLLGRQWQRPKLMRHWHLMERQKELPTLPEGVVAPTIVTGLDGLGRNTDIQKLDLLLLGVAERFGPDAVKAEAHVGEYIKRRAAALGIDIKGLIKTPEEKSQEQQQALMGDLAGKAIGPGINAMSKQQEMMAQQQAPPAMEG